MVYIRFNLLNYTTFFSVLQQQQFYHNLVNAYIHCNIFIISIIILFILIILHESCLFFDYYYSYYFQSLT